MIINFMIIIIIIIISFFKHMSVLILDVKI